MNDDPGEALALARYALVAAYNALEPARGDRRATLVKLCARGLRLPDGTIMVVGPDTLRVWVRRYNRGGLDALRDKERKRRGCAVLDEATQELLCGLKTQQPTRSLDCVIEIATETGLVPPNLVTRSTLHRVLQSKGLSRRPPKAAGDDKDLDRFEAKYPNDLWQSDMLQGPWLPDPDQPDKKRQTWLFAYLDDHSRRVLAGRFAFRGAQPDLELVFRRALQRCGVPKRVYYDNGGVYRSHHMKRVVAEMGIEGIAFTQRQRPMGHGKIEAFNHFCTNAFIAEVPVSPSITDLDSLNAAFQAWVELKYNDRVHSETTQTPNARWNSVGDRIKLADEEKLRRAFLWEESRKADKTGLFSLFGVRFQVSATWAGRRVQVHFDPEDLSQVEIWVDRAFCERLQPFTVSEHRRPKAAEPQPNPKPAAPAVDWLAHIRARQDLVDKPPRTEAERRIEAAAPILAALAERLHPDVVDADHAIAFLERFGPFVAEDALKALDEVIARLGRDQHQHVYLEAIRAAAGVRP